MLRPGTRIAYSILFCSAFQSRSHPDSVSKIVSLSLSFSELATLPPRSERSLLETCAIHLRAKQPLFSKQSCHLYFSFDIRRVKSRRSKRQSPTANGCVRIRIYFAEEYVVIKFSVPPFENFRLYGQFSLYRARRDAT